MLLGSVLKEQKSGRVLGLPSICSSHPWVIKAALQGKNNVLIEATCNQVNQFGGYSGMRPRDFIAYVENIAASNNFPKDEIIFGGDHLGPNVWKGEPTQSAMTKSKVLISEYVKAGFRKLHVDCSMPLGDDPAGALAPEVASLRSAELIKVAEDSLEQGTPKPWYVIGTEVPVPGGHKSQDREVEITSVENVSETIELMKKDLIDLGLGAAWDRVIAVVVQPGVDFGEDFIIPYDPSLAKHLKKFIEDKPLVYEAHSTDYQTKDALTNLVRDHFAILKVGPGLTFTFREAVFELASIEEELIQKGARSNLVNVIDDVMLKKPKYWNEYYNGDAESLTRARLYSYSDRIRYYWNEEPVKVALNRLFTNLNERKFGDTLMSIIGQVSAKEYVLDRITEVLDTYNKACGLRGGF